jgi:hypothetical protein
MALAGRQHLLPLRPHNALVSGCGGLPLGMIGWVSQRGFTRGQ